MWLNCDETLGRSAIDDLAAQTGLPIKIDPTVDNDISGAVSLKVKQIQLRSALGLLLEPLGLAYIPRGDHLEIAIPAKADQTLIGKIYPVADLTTDPEFTERDLADLIMAVVRPPTGLNNSVFPGNCVAKPGVLVVSESHQVHETIARFLEELRRYRDPQRPPRRQTPAEAAVKRALASRVTVRVDRPWREAIAQLAQQHRFNLVIDESHIQEILGRPNTPLTSAPSPDSPRVLKDVAFSLALDLLLEPLGCTWVIRHEALVVTTNDQAEQWLSLQMHPFAITTARHDPDNVEFRFLMENVHDITWGRGLSVSLGRGPAFAMVSTGGAMAVMGNRMMQNESAMLLPRLRQAADPFVVDYDERATSPAAAKLWRTLDQPTSLDYSLQPFTLREVLDDLARRHGVQNIVVRIQALEDAGVAAELDRWRPSLRAKGIRLASAISLLLKPLGLSWYARDNVLIVTSKDDADQHDETRVYRAAYLGERRELDEQTFIELVLDHVRPDSWSDGNAAQLSIFAVPGIAAIPQTRDIHDDLRWFLHKLEAHLNFQADSRNSLADTPAERRLYAALERPVTYHAVDQPLDQVFSELAGQAGLENLIYNWRAIEDAGLDRDKLRSTQVTQDFKNVPLRHALSTVGKAYDLDWAIDHELLSITSRDDAEQYLVNGFYRFPHGLFDPPGSSAPGPPADRYYYHEALVEQIQTHVDPKAWQEDAGAGSISALRSGIVVTNTPAIHCRVRRFLNHLRYALDDAFEVPAANRPLPPDELAGICTALGELARGPTARLREVLGGAMAHADKKVQDAAKKALDKINRKPQRK